MMRDKEYEALRTELVEWQSRRFNVATGSILVVVGVLGWAVSAPDKWSWDLVSSITSFVLAISCGMIWQIGLSNSRISTYIEVFHEESSTGLGWEGRQRKFKKELGSSSRGMYVLMFLGVKVLSLILACIICKRQHSLLGFVGSLGLLLVFLITLALLCFSSPSRWHCYIEQWQKIKKQEAEVSNGVNSSDETSEIFPTVLPGETAQTIITTCASLSEAGLSRPITED